MKDIPQILLCLLVDHGWHPAAIDGWQRMLLEAPDDKTRSKIRTQLLHLVLAHEVQAEMQRRPPGAQAKAVQADIADRWGVGLLTVQTACKSAKNS